MLQEASPFKYSSPSNSILTPLVNNSYVKAHRSKVQQQEQMVNSFVQSRSNLFPSPKNYNGDFTSNGSGGGRDSSMRGMTKSDSNGFLSLTEGDDRRRQGSTMIARQIELENMKAR